MADGIKGPDLDATTVALIAALETAGASPVIARNYENYPSFGHDLDLFVAGDPGDCERPFAEVGRAQGWDLVTRCDHYASFGHDVLSIPVFRFHHKAPLATLQVDLFGGFVLMGLPFWSRHQICASRELEPGGRFHVMKPALEHLYRLFQIQSLHGTSNTEKVERYRQRTLAFEDRNPGAISAQGRADGLGGFEGIIDQLRVGDIEGARKALGAKKKRHFARQLIRSPFRSALMLIDRKIGYHRQFQTDPCGPTLTLAGAASDWASDLDALVESQALNGWSDCKDRRERGWALVRFKDGGLTTGDREGLAAVVYRRHRVIFSSKSS